MAAQVIGTRFRLDQRIGQGGMGTVYRGVDTQTGDKVAIKQLQQSVVVSEPDIIERFAREGEALRQLNHPNIVKMLAAYEDDGNHYLVMEYVSGGDLNDMLKEGKMPIKQVLEIALDLADALTRAHRLQIIHRDLKPANVLLADDGTPRLTDFGVAHFGSKERMTGTGVAVGTIDYISPEALKGDQVDARTDIWSFGVMLFEMLTGRRPFTGETITYTLMSIVTDPVPDLEHLRPDAPVGLIDLIYRMLEKDPHARIPSVRQVGLELEALLQGRSPDSTQSTPKIVDPKRFATPTPPPHVHRHNLPAQTTPFVGRETELAQVTKLLNDKSARLITILASGGMGKTRLALEVAGHYTEVSTEHSTSDHDIDFHHGVYFVELAPLSAVENIPSAIADAVSYQFQSDGRDPKEQILDYLREKTALLVMDNFEHLIAGAGIVADILRAAPNVKVLATSRQRLNQSGESIVNLEGMDFPDWETPADALEYSAVKLFMQSAQRARPGFELHADDLQYIARICRMVHGLPLGILLAASWLEMLSPQEIADEMARSLDFLETEMSDIPTRQRSIRAVFEYSWDLMTPDEQAAFMRLSVFRGGFTREAAQAVANASLRVLMSLLNKSLLRRDPDSGRYSVHDLLGNYAAEQLERSGAAEATHMAHSDYFAAYVHERELPLLGAEQAKVFKEVETEMENIGDAACWAAMRHKWDNIDRSMQALTLYFEMVSRFREGAKMIHELEQLLLENGLPEDHRVLWRVRARKSHVLSRGGEYLEGFKLGEECLAYFEHLDDQQEVAYICASQSYAAMMQGRYADAKAYGKRALDIGMERGYRWEMLGGAFNLGYAHFLAGEYAEAKHIYERILEKAKGFGSPPATTAFASNNLGEVHHALGEETQAKALFEEAHRLFKQINNKYGMAFTCNNLGNVAHACADFQTAQHCNQQALDLYREIGDRRGTGDALNRLGGLTYSLGNYRAAKTYHQEALTIYRAIGDRRGIANSLVMLAMNHNALGEDAECENILLESLALRREMGNPSEVIDSLQLLGLTGGVSGGSLEKSLLYLDEADAMLAQAGASEAQLGGRAPIFRAIIYLYHERFTEALPIFLAALPGAEAVGVWWAVMQVYYGLGCAYVGLANYAEAKTFLRKALNIAKDIRAFDWMVHTFIWGAHIAAQQGRAADAVTWWLFVIDYPACYFPMRELAKRRLTETEAMLSPDAYAAAAARAKTLDLETVTAEVLGILEEARA